MNPELITAVVALARTLTEENEALRALDVARATALLGRKRTEAHAFAIAQAGLPALSAEHLALARRVAARLAEAAAENKRLLERAIAVQGAVIATLVRAVPASLAVPRYGATGTRVGRPPPISLSSRV